MHQTTASRAAPQQADDLELALRRQGYARGFPPTLTEENRVIDRSIVKRLRCPGCRKAGMEARPHHKPRQAYRIVAVCPACGAGEEV